METPEQRKARALRDKAKKQGNVMEKTDETKQDGTPATEATDETKQDGTRATEASVDTTVLDWLHDHDYDIVKRAEDHAPAPVKTFENPPEDLFEGFEYSGPPDGNERLLVQVSEDDLKAGRHKVLDLRKDGWVVEKVFLDGALVRMKLPAEKLAALRKGREEQYLSYLKPKRVAAPTGAVNPQTGEALGSDITETVGPEGAPLTTEQILDLSRIAG